MELPLRPQVPWKELVPACEGDVTYTWTYTDCAGFTHDYVSYRDHHQGGLHCAITYHSCGGLLCGYRITNPSYRYR